MNDLRDFIRLLTSEGELVIVDREVDPVLEITEITDRVSKAGGPALLFTRPKGRDIPVLMNQFGSERRTALGLRVGSLEELREKVRSLVAFNFPQGLREKLDALSKLKGLASLAPTHVKEAPCQEVVHKGKKVDLSRLPVLTCWPGDGGPFITLPLVFTRDPVTGRSNTGMYRMQVYDRETTGMHWHIHKDAADHFRRAGSRLEAAVAIGSDPAVTYAATAPVPKVLDEMMLAGFLRGKAVEMAKCLTVDLSVPAHAEIVLEGYVDVDEARVEGPFGDHTGFYSPADGYPVFHVTALTHRRNPIYAATVVGRPPMEDCFLAKATERLFLPLLQMVVPEVVDMDLPMEGAFHNCALVSIRKTYPQQARKVIHAIWGTGQLQFTKFVVVFDEHVDVHDYREAAWFALSNVDPGRDVVLSEGPLDVLDHASPQPKWGGKMGLDATRKRPDEGHGREWPEEIVMSPEVKARVDSYWPNLVALCEGRSTSRRRKV
jgi:4-hydroxy-3-polyprenylbenzoate decarboxylase